MGTAEPAGCAIISRKILRIMRLKPMFIRYAACTAFWVVAAVALCHAQEPAIGVPVPPLGAGPFVLDTAEQHKIRVTVLARGLSHPWAIAFLPEGGMLITERLDGCVFSATERWIRSPSGAGLKCEPMAMADWW